MEMVLFSIPAFFIFCFGVFFFFLIWWKIFSKAGYSGAMGLLMAVPFVNFIMLLILAFGDWPVQKELRGETLALPKKQSKKWLWVLVIVVGLPLLVLSVVIVGPALEYAAHIQKEDRAKSVLRYISKAAENYSKVNGRYPESAADLLHSHPPYLTQNFCGQKDKGYYFTCQFSNQSYVVKAESLDLNEGSLMIQTGGILVQTDVEREFHDVQFFKRANVLDEL